MHINILTLKYVKYSEQAVKTLHNKAHVAIGIVDKLIFNAHKRGTKITAYIYFKRRTE